MRRLIDAGRVPGVVTETLGGVVRHKIPVDAVKPERSTNGRGASYDHDTIRALLADGMSVDDVCRIVGCGLSLVYQIRGGSE